MEITSNETKEDPTDECWERTNKQKKFLKKPNNKTAVKHFFRELLEKSVVVISPYKSKRVDPRILSDLATCAKIFKVAEISTKLHLELLLRLMTTFYLQYSPSAIDAFFKYAKHDLLSIFFKTLIKLKPRVLAGEELPTAVFQKIQAFFLEYLSYKRVRKLLKSTQNFDVISETKFWEPIFLVAKNPRICVQALIFPMKMSNQKSFSQDFVEMFVNRIREIFPLVTNEKTDIQLISIRIMESEQRNFFLKLVSQLPENMRVISEKPTDLTPWGWKIMPVGGRVLALVSCAKCDTKETSEKEFAKCSRCNFVHYCSKVCQEADWENHREICK
jgi:hypothetical protein